MDAVLQQVLPYLPPNIQAILQNPPNLSDPRSFWPLVRAIFPYAKFIVVILAFYIVWTTLAAVFGYFGRFLRFAVRIGPILGLLAWIMAASGQGSMNDVFELVKQWTGISPQNVGAQLPPGLASLAGWFGDTSAPSSRRKRQPSTSNSRYSPRGDHASSRTRNKKKNDAPADVFAEILKSAVGDGGTNGADWQSTAQDFVKKAVAKATGLGWLLGEDRGL